MRDGIAEPSIAVNRSAGKAFGRAALMLAFATAIAVTGTAAISILVLQADCLNAAAALINRAAFAHGAIAVALASSPIVAVLLVGYAYMQRGVRRRAAARRAAHARG